jgi:hypothetical protein
MVNQIPSIGMHAGPRDRDKSIGVACDDGSKRAIRPVEAWQQRLGAHSPVRVSDLFSILKKQMSDLSSRTFFSVKNKKWNIPFHLVVSSSRVYLSSAINTSTA